jgi:LmbE family N-acetylglucosaminyl deacetylase
MAASTWTGRRWEVETDAALPTRKEFLLAITATAAAAQQLTAQEPPPHASGRKLLIVVAHPDDEYAFAAATYRLVRELGWTADQVVITNGEAGYRYSSLAAAVYGVALSTEQDRRARLPAIRKEEAVRAGKILGIRRHYFLDQKDLGFARDAASADSSNWDRRRVLSFLSELLARERYDAVFTLLPTAQTHGHHRAATLLALQSVSALPPERRPLIFGADPRAKSDPAPPFTGLPGQPLSATVSADPVLSFDRTVHFGYANALDYQVIVNWVIAEHKSQGLFQMDAGRHDLEQFWLFEVSGKEAAERAHALEDELRVNRRSAAAR